eukprot:COSAG02_NODE_453_length_22025_cov_16.179923_14_plen_59_part_00
MCAVMLWCVDASAGEGLSFASESTQCDLRCGVVSVGLAEWDGGSSRCPESNSVPSYAE